MANADTDIPKFKTYAEGEPIPPVEPEDLRRRWRIPIPWSREALEEAWGHEADIAAVSSRSTMINMLARYNRSQLLAPWHHGEELDDAVFRIAATFPLREVKHKSYMIPGDEYFGFDPNAFVQRLIEETGFSHVWEPVKTKVAEGGRTFAISVEGSQGHDPDTVARREARQLFWEIWNRFSNLEELLALSDKEGASRIVGIMFSDFVIDNIDLFRAIEAGFKAGNTPGGLPVLMELERRAQHAW